MACCINFAYTNGNTFNQSDYDVTGFFNGFPYYELDIAGTSFFLWWNSSGPGVGQWVITDGVGSFTGLIGGTKETLESTCPPQGNSGDGNWEAQTGIPNFDSFQVADCAVDCQCIIVKIENDGNPVENIEVINSGTFNGRYYYEFVYYGVNFSIWFDGGFWIITEFFNDVNNIYGRFTRNDECPIAELGTISNYSWIINLNALPNLTQFTTDSIVCPNPCPCVQLIYTDALSGQVVSVIFEQSNGFFNGSPYWEYQLPNSPGLCLYIFLFKDENGCCQWQMRIADCGTQNIDLGSLIGFYGIIDCDEPCDDCPFGLYTLVEKAVLQPFSSAQIVDCSDVIVCDYLQDRTQKEYQAIKFPEIFEEEKRGWTFGCCETMLVLADPTSSDSWKNDVNSAWIKLSDPTDSVSFKLYKDNIETNFQPLNVAFPNEIDAYYATINWIDVLNSEGIGCYTWKVEYNISGVIGTFIWGVYHLKQFTIDNAKETARVRVKFNLIQAIEGINFTDANVEDSLRFHGFIGDRQPNMEIDNLVYQNRELKTVIRQNLNEYYIKTDPSSEDITRKLCDLYLLSENEMFISDYNVFNHSYRYNDLPVIVSQSPELNYIDKYQRKAIVECIVADRTKNQRTFY